MLTGLFVIFDRMVGKHQKKMLDATKQSDAIVRSLFPDAVADRLYEDARMKEIQKSKSTALESRNKQIRNFMKSPTLISESNDGDVLTGTAPIAELFSDTTILFADFVGTSIPSFHRFFTLNISNIGKYIRLHRVVLRERTSPSIHPA